jgi:hypothetical protein
MSNTKLFKTSSGVITLLDEADWEWAKDLSWSLNTGGYLTNKKIGMLHKMILIHKIIQDSEDPVEDYYLYTTKKLCCDHINRTILDNRRNNLRLVSYMVNNRNHGLNKNNKTGYVGVLRFKDKYEARIFINGRPKYIGRFDTAKEAHLARLKWEQDNNYRFYENT